MNLDNMKQWYKGHRYDVFVMLSCFAFILLFVTAADGTIVSTGITSSSAKMIQKILKNLFIFFYLSVSDLNVLGQ